MKVTLAMGREKSRGGSAVTTASAASTTSRRSSPLAASLAATTKNAADAPCATNRTVPVTVAASAVQVTPSGSQRPRESVIAAPAISPVATRSTYGCASAPAWAST